jgi:NAD-dependent SIR2 family protein deacetylase
MSTSNPTEYPHEVHLYAEYERCAKCNANAERLKYEQNANRQIIITPICVKCYAEIHLGVIEIIQKTFYDEEDYRVVLKLLNNMLVPQTDIERVKTRQLFLRSVE